MKYLLVFLTFISLISFSFTSNYDCRSFNFGDTPETIMKRESAEFVREEQLSHNLVGLTFVEYVPNKIIQYTYTFHNGKLNGMKTKKLSSTGDNSYLNAYTNYREALAKYSADCELKIKERVGDKGLRSFQFATSKSKTFVMMQQESQDFFLVENIFKK